VAVAFNEPRFAIEPSDYRCTSCSAEVPVDAPFFSAVFFEGETFHRRSYCAACWVEPPPPARPEIYAFWRSRRPAPQAAPRKLRFDPELVLEFFRRLGPRVEEPAAGQSGEAAAPQAGESGEGAVGKTRLRLVLALLLLRRKLLVYQSAASREGREWLKLSEKADPSRVHQVENPPQTDAELEEVKTSLGDLLQMEI
jgi:hypothetical protein